MPENINQPHDILIIPHTYDIEDIINTDITTYYAFNIQILNLSNIYGIAIYNPLLKNQSFNDMLSEEPTEYIFGDDRSPIDMTVQAYSEHEIQLNKDTEENSQIKAYLYDSDKNRIGDIFTKNITLKFLNKIDIIGINIQNNELDGTIVYNDGSALEDEVLFGEIKLNITKGKETKNQYYVRENSVENSIQIGYIEDSNIISLEKDPESIFTYGYIIKIDMLDVNYNQVAETYLDFYKLSPSNCFIPQFDFRFDNSLSSCSLTFYPQNDSNGYGLIVNPPPCLVGDIDFFTRGIYLNAYTQKDQTWPILKKDKFESALGASQQGPGGSEYDFYSYSSFKIEGLTCITGNTKEDLYPYILNDESEFIHGNVVYINYPNTDDGGDGGMGMLSASFSFYKEEDESISNETVTKIDTTCYIYEQEKRNEFYAKEQLILADSTTNNDPDSIWLKFYNPLYGGEKYWTGDQQTTYYDSVLFRINLNNYDGGDDFQYGSANQVNALPVRYEDYTNSSYDDTYYDAHLYTYAQFGIIDQRFVQNLPKNIINGYINEQNQNQLVKYGEFKFSYTNQLKFPTPIMCRIETSDKIRFYIVSSLGTSKTGILTTLDNLPESYNPEYGPYNGFVDEIAFEMNRLGATSDSVLNLIRSRAMIDEIVLPGVPLEIKETKDQYMLAMGDSAYNNPVSIFVEFLDTQNANFWDTTTATIVMQFGVVQDEYLRVLKIPNFTGIYDENYTGQSQTNQNAEIDYINIINKDNERTDFWVGADIETLICASPNKRKLEINWSNVPTQPQLPFVEWDNTLNEFGDLSFKIAPFTTDVTNSLCSFTFRLTKIDSTELPSDQTTITDLDIGDIVHVFGFEIANHYLVEYYTTPDDTLIGQSQVGKYSFRTVSGTCSIPIVVRDQTIGRWTITCSGTCYPAYRWRSDSKRDGNDSMHQLHYQEYYGIFPEEIIYHPSLALVGYDESAQKMYMQPNDQEVVVNMGGGIITGNTMASGARFEFACIGETKDYFSDIITESENYPSQTMVPPDIYSNAGMSSWTLYERNYARGTGTIDARREFRKNGATIQTNGGTASSFSVAMAIGDVLEFRQHSNNLVHSPSWIITQKRWQ